MRRVLLVSVLCMFPLMMAEATPPLAELWPAVVTLDTVMGHPGESVGIPMRLSTNDRQFSGIQIPLEIVSPHLRYDSVSFVGSMMTTQFSGLVNHPAGTDSVDVILLPDFVSPIPTISAAEGLIATLWVTVEEWAAPGLAEVDSVAIDTVYEEWDPPTRYWKLVNGSDRYGVTLLPGFNGGGVLVEMATDVTDGAEGILPTEFTLDQNYPNPFNPSTVIEFAVPRATEVRLSVYNVLGQEMAVLVNGEVAAGGHRVTWDASGIPSGIYFYRLSHATGTETRKMTLVK